MHQICKQIVESRYFFFRNGVEILPRWIEVRPAECGRVRAATRPKLLDAEISPVTCTLLLERSACAILTPVRNHLVLHSVPRNSLASRRRHQPPPPSGAVAHRGAVWRRPALPFARHFNSVTHRLAL